MFEAWYDQTWYTSYYVEHLSAGHCMRTAVKHGQQLVTKLEDKMVTPGDINGIFVVEVPKGAYTKSGGRGVTSLGYI